MFELFGTSIVGLLGDPQVMFLLAFGSILGVVFSALPGLNATLGVAVLLPVTFTMTPGIGIGFLTSIYIGAMCGGLFGATLLRIPGNPSSVATTFDGYPLAQRGFAVKALSTGILANFVGGILGLLALVGLAPVIARFALSFGPYEMTVLTLMAMLLVVTLSSENMVKGLIAAALGLAVSIVGFSPMDGAARLTFGQVSLTGGFAIVPVIVGLFAISQVLREAARQPVKVSVDLDVKGIAVTLREIRDNLWNMFRSSMIGVWIGVLPGIGSSASSLVAWAVAKQSSKTPEEFGKGSIEGIWASESSNNANVGGSLLPLLTLGIPGDAVTALMIAGFMIHGLQPGPLMFAQQPGIIADIYAAFLYATIIVLIFQIATLRIFPRILLVPKYYLLPIMVVLTVVGAYSADNQASDVFVMLAFGLVGLVLERYGYPIAVLVLGYILGPILELNLRRALTFDAGDLTPFVTRPVSATLVAVTVLAMAYIFWANMKGKRIHFEDD